MVTALLIDGVASQAALTNCENKVLTIVKFTFGEELAIYVKFV